MVAGRLQEKNGFYYIVLSYTDSAGKRRQPWIGTGLPVKGNKKRAEKMLAETRKDFTIPKGQVSELSPDMAFSDYMRYWLKMMRTAVTETTYSSYCFNVEKHIIPYFEPLGVTLAGLQPRQIQSFYLHEAETLKNTSILRFHANLHKALKYAVRIDLIASNPVDKVDRPKPQAFMASYYSAEEMEKLFEAAQGHKQELIIQLAAFYGVRRAEVMGLRWEAIDFEAKTLTIRHIVTSTRIDGKKILVEAARAKRRGDLKVRVGDGSDAAAGEHGSREPHSQRNQEGTGGNRSRESDEHQRDPRGGRDRAEHADERLYPVGEGLVEADGDTGQYADNRTAEPAEEQQACGVCKAGREERAVLNENAEHTVERGKVQHRQNRKLGGQQVEDVQHQNRSCIEQCAVRQLIAYLGVAERYQQGNHIHGQSDEQRPCKIRMFCGRMLRGIRQKNIAGERQQNRENRQ